MEMDLDNRTSVEVTSLCFKDALHLAVGLSNGYTLLYDIRSSQPYLSKSHNFGLPITQVDFAREQELVLSMDGRVLKLWNEHSGQPFTSLEPGTDLNSFARYQNSGLIFFANDDPKVRQYFVPSLGPAPRWCSQLESITEELEAERSAAYDDFKFVTKAQLDDLGLSKLLGTSAARAYMHGYFIELKTYLRAKDQSQMSAAEAYKERKIQEKLTQEREVNFVKRDRTRKLPKVNRELATRLQQIELSLQTPPSVCSEKTKMNELLEDQRFGSLFTDPDFEIEEESEQFRQLAPLMKRLEAKKQKLEKVTTKDDDGIVDE